MLGLVGVICTDDENSNVKSCEDYINKSNDDCNSSGEYENESRSIVDEKIKNFPDKTQTTSSKIVPGFKDLSQTLKREPKQSKLVRYFKNQCSHKTKHFSSN